MVGCVLQSIVGRFGNVMDQTVAFQDWNEREKQWTVKTAVVQVILRERTHRDAHIDVNGKDEEEGRGGGGGGGASESGPSRQYKVIKKKKTKQKQKK